MADKLGRPQTGGGSTTAGFIRNFRALSPKGVCTNFFNVSYQDIQQGQWMGCGIDRASNGALMRISPIILPHLKNPSPQLWKDAAIVSSLTHFNSASTASCVAFTYMLWQLLSMSSPPPPEWYSFHYGFAHT